MKPNIFELQRLQQENYRLYSKIQSINTRRPQMTGPPATYLQAIPKPKAKSMRRANKRNWSTFRTHKPWVGGKRLSPRGQFASIDAPVLRNKNMI